jgi:hypothetical protein
MGNPPIICEVGGLVLCVGLDLLGRAGLENIIELRVAECIAVVCKVADKTTDAAIDVEHLIIERGSLAICAANHHTPTVKHIEVLIVLVGDGLLEVETLGDVAIDEDVETVFLANECHMDPLLHWEIVYIDVGIPRAEGVHIDTHSVLVVVHIDTGTKEWVLEAVALVKDVEEPIIRPEARGIHEEEEGVGEFCAGALIVGQVELLGIRVTGVLCKCLGLGTGEGIIH